LIFLTTLCLQGGRIDLIRGYCIDPERRGNSILPSNRLNRNIEESIMTRKFILWGLIGLYLIVPVVGRSTAYAVMPTIWRDDSQADFEKGKPENVSITSQGEVVLAPLLEEVADTDELYVWCLTQDKEGNLYAGTGNEGRIYKIDSQGDKTLLYDSPEVGIHSLALDDEGNLYAGSSPDGIVYKITAQGEAQTLCTTGERYVWSLVIGPEGQLYAGTGEAAKVLKISQDGEVEEIYASTDNHIMSLVLDGESGHLYAGTEGSGIVYQISPEGDVRVLYDAPEREIHSLVLGDDGVLYAGAMTGPQPPVRAEKGRRTNISNDGSSIYGIFPSGAVWSIWRSPQPLLLSMIWNVDGDLMVGTGEEGLIYSVTPEGDFTLVARCPQGQPLSLHRGGEGQVYLGISGKVYRFSSRYATKGTLTSPEHDNSINSKWGKISWRAEIPEGTRITFQTRSGNTEHADDTWSDWSEELQDSEGSQIPSPPARFLQYRANLYTSDSARTPVLKRVSITSLQSNLKPKVRSVTIRPYVARPEEMPPEASGPQGRGMEGRAQVPPPERRREPFKKTLKVVRWQADDPNGDLLVYDLYFRGMDEKDWKLLKEDVKGSFYIWDTESCPDGIQLVRVVASDVPSNPPELALSAERVSEPFIVDNTPPVVRKLKVEKQSHGKLVIRGEAEDKTSSLKKAEYSIDSGDWKIIFPQDGIFDSKKEKFTFTTDVLSPGEHTIVIRITDFSDNIGVGKLVAKVKDISKR